MPTTQDLLPYIGKRVLYGNKTYEPLKFIVTILDGRQTYGRLEFLIEPESGTGQKWIDVNNCSNITEE